MTRGLRALAFAATILCSASFITEANAQEVRYSWVDLGFTDQDVSRSGMAVDPVGNQSYDFNASDGTGVRFRGSVGTWNNFYGVVEFVSSDPDVQGVVTNNVTGFQSAVEDEFDLTTIRGGIGFRFQASVRTDIFVEVTYDSIDYDFGNPVPSAPEFDFDIDEQDIGASLGVRSMLNDRFEVRAYGRYSNIGDVDLTNRTFDSDTLFGAGFGYTIVRGLSITGDYESGEIDTWSIGFRLDLDED